MWVARMEWDPGNVAEVVAARAAFGLYEARGYLAFRSGTREAVQAFDRAIGSIEFHTRSARTRYNVMMEDEDDG